MKRLLTFALLSISILSSCNSKQGMQDIQENTIQQEVKAQSNSGVNSYLENIAKYLFNLGDKNKNGFITTDELSSGEEFDRLDINKDKKISLDEFKKATQGGLTKGMAREGIVSAANSYTNMKIFTYSYTGSMTKEQFLIYAQNSYMTKEPLNIFYVADKNNDGKLSFSEFEDCSYAITKGNIDNMKDGSYKATEITNPIMLEESKK